MIEIINNSVYLINSSINYGNIIRIILLMFEIITNSVDYIIKRQMIDRRNY